MLVITSWDLETVIMLFPNENYNDLTDWPLLAISVSPITPGEKFSLMFVKNSLHVFDETK